MIQEETIYLNLLETFMRPIEISDEITVWIRKKDLYVIKSTDCEVWLKMYDPKENYTFKFAWKIYEVYTNCW